MYRHCTRAGRVALAALLRAGHSQRSVALELGVNQSSLSSALRRNVEEGKGYHAPHAASVARARRRKSKVRLPENRERPPPPHPSLRRRYPAQEEWCPPHAHRPQESIREGAEDSRRILRSGACGTRRTSGHTSRPFMHVRPRFGILTLAHERTGHRRKGILRRPSSSLCQSPQS